VFYGPKWAAPPLVLERICKSQETKLARNAVKYAKQFKKFLLVKNINLYHKILNMKYVFYAYFRTEKWPQIQRM
jgi:hypothetical protein